MTDLRFNGKKVEPGHLVKIESGGLVSPDWLVVKESHGGLYTSPDATRAHWLSGVKVTDHLIPGVFRLMGGDYWNLAVGVDPADFSTPVEVEERVEKAEAYAQAVSDTNRDNCARANAAEATLAAMSKERDRWWDHGYKLGSAGQLQAERDLAEERAKVERVKSVCQNTDGEWLDGDAEIPVGEVLRMLAIEGKDEDHTPAAPVATEPARAATSRRTYSAPPSDGTEADHV